MNSNEILLFKKGIGLMIRILFMGFHFIFHMKRNYIFFIFLLLLSVNMSSLTNIDTKSTITQTTTTHIQNPHPTYPDDSSALIPTQLAFSNNQELDSYFAGNTTTGLTKEKSYLIRDMNLQNIPKKPILKLLNIDRFLSITNCTFSGDSASIDNDEFTYSAIYCSNVTNLNLSLCSFGNFQYGIYCELCKNITIQGNTFNTIGTNALYLIIGSNFTIIHNFFWNQTNVLIYLNDLSNCSLAYNQIESELFVKDCTTMNIYNNTFRTTNTALCLFTSDSNCIERNYFVSDDQTVIVEQSNKNLFKENQIICLNPNHFALYESPDSVENIYDGNTISGRISKKGVIDWQSIGYYGLIGASLGIIAFFLNKGFHYYFEYYRNGVKIGRSKTRFSFDFGYMIFYIIGGIIVGIVLYFVFNQGPI